MKMSRIATPVLALALALAGAPAARADEAPKAEASKSIEWVDGWSNGLAAAKKANKLMFVYVGRKSPT